MNYDDMYVYIRYQSVVPRAVLHVCRDEKKNVFHLSPFRWSDTAHPQCPIDRIRTSTGIEKYMVQSLHIGLYGFSTNLPFGICTLYF